MITGATGVTGKNAIAQLMGLNILVRALAHRLDERSKALEAQEWKLLKETCPILTVSARCHMTKMIIKKL